MTETQEPLNQTQIDHLELASTEISRAHREAVLSVHSRSCCSPCRCRRRSSRSVSRNGRRRSACSSRSSPACVRARDRQLRGDAGPPGGEGLNPETLHGLRRHGRGQLDLSDASSSRECSRSSPAGSEPATTRSCSAVMAGCSTCPASTTWSVRASPRPTTFDRAAQEMVEQGHAGLARSRIRGPHSLPCTVSRVRLAFT